MINVTPQFRQALYDGNRNYLETVKITLTDGTVLNLTNEDIWQGSMSFEDAVSSDSDFQIGAAIINKQKLQLNNMYEDFSDYVFEGAEVITNIGLACGTNGAVERIRKGTFIVDTADYDEAIVTLNLLDYMSKFDKPFSGVNISYPAQTYEIISAICTHCGVTLGTLTFPHNTFEIESGPESTTCSCREVLSWVAQICGCFARCDTQGRLELKWYDTNALDSFLDGLDGGVFDETTSSSYQTGDTADGGSFNPWNTGYVYDDGDFAQVLKNVHVISETFSHSISVDDVVITGVRILVKRKSGTGNEIETISRGSAGYVIEISNNELITLDNANTIADWLATQLIGLTFRKANASIPSDPSIEAGDVGIIFDRKGNNFPILISKTIFSPFGQQTVVSSAQTPARNSAARYSAETKNYVELRKQIKQSESNWAVAEQRLAQAIANANGLFQTDVTDPQTGAVTHYLHNKGPDGTADDQSGLNASDIRIVISDVGITMTANGTAQTPTWYGLTVDGNLISSIINTIEISFSRGKGGRLKLGGPGNGNGWLLIVDDDDNEVGRWTRLGIKLTKGDINLGNGKFVAANNGDVTAKSFTANDYIYVDGNSSSMIRIPYTAYDFYSNTLYTTLASGGVSVDFGRGEIEIGSIISRGSSNGRYPYDDYPMLKSAYISSSYKWESWLDCAGLHVSKLNGTSSGSFLSVAELSHDYLDITTYDSGGNIAFYCTVNGPSKQVTIAHGSVVVTGTKSRLAETKDYNDRLLYCYETPTPMFGDIGEGVIGEDGLCYVPIDPVFSETVTTTQYQVFLQRYGEGDCYVKERTASYFVVKGTPNLSFGWELKARQLGYEERRLDDINFVNLQKPEETDYSDLALEHINEINGVRKGVANESSNISNNME